MAEFYNAETLLEFVKQNTPHIDGETTMKCVERAMKEAPTADAVEVVRGKDCKRYSTELRMCLSSSGIINAKPDDFCSYGERKDE